MWQRRNTDHCNAALPTFVILITVVCLAFSVAVSCRAQEEATGCVPGGTKTYNDFAEDDFSYLEDTLQIDDDGHIVLNTGRQAINKERIKITSTQEVKVSFLYEGAGYISHFGYFLLSKAKDKGYVSSDGTTLYFDDTFKSTIDFSSASYDSDTFHYLFKSIEDDNTDCCDGGDGVLDIFMDNGELTSSVTTWLAANSDKTAEDYVAQYDDGTGYAFVVNGDGELTSRDMTKSLGLIAENEEVVFFLVADGNFDNIYFNKTAYNPDTYTSIDCSDSSTINKVYRLALPRIESGCTLESGWLSESTVSRLNSQFGITLSPEDVHIMQIHRDQKYSHMIVGAPADDPTQWILGWEDLYGGGDTDHNDMVFKVQRKTDGRAVTTMLSQTVADLPNTYITAVDIEVQDYIQNCVSGVLNAANVSFANDNIIGDWTDTPDSCESPPDCIHGCTGEDRTGSLAISNLTVSGDISEDLGSVSLSAQTVASIDLNFSGCQRYSSFFHSCRDIDSHDSSFPVSTTPVTLSSQNVSVNSQGVFSGAFEISGQMSAEDGSNDRCFENWAGTLSKTVTLTGQLNGDWDSRKNEIRYFVSIDDGNVWVEITHWDSDVANDDGTHTKKARIDFLAMGLVGNQLKWKAVFESNDDHCTPPEIYNVDLSYDASGNNFFSRADPVVQGNVLYSGSFETPAASWNDKTKLHGHVNAYRIYDPNDPSQPAYSELWDAGEQLAQRNLTNDPRTIFVAMPTPVSVSAHELGTGDGHTIEYSGSLPNGRILAGSLTISDRTESFTDSGVNTLAGDKGGSGTINRFTGEYTLTFMHPPSLDVPILADYMHYPNTSDADILGEFKSDYVTNTMLGITDEYAEGAGYTYDLNNDDSFDDDDRIHLIKWVQGFADGSGESQREWLLDAIDHSTPALAGPPALPAWYYGIDITEEEREAFDAWAHTLKNRRSVLYIGSRSGMLHAFDAGAFQHGDNPATDFMENRGYFASSSGSVDYGTGEELWAFIPNNCLPRLKFHVERTLADADPPYVDASPSLEDIFYREGNELVFKTVLFSAEGNGGDTVFALDITDPYNPSFMWEFGDPALWRSKSSPPIGKIVRLNAGGEAKWVVLFVSGQTGSDQHPSVFMVDALSGALLKNIVLDEPGDANLGALLSGSPAIADANGNGYVDRFYVGDDKGHMYRVNIPDNPSNLLDLDEIQDCVLVKVSQPVYASPTVYSQTSYDDDGYVSEYHMKIMFGTGDSPYFNDDPNYSGTVYKFYVFDDACGPLGLDSRSRDNSGLECTCSQIQEETDAVWSWSLPAGERIWAEAYAAAGVVYFGTATSDTEDPCSPPTTGSSHGSLYSLDLAALPEQPSVVQANVGNVMGIVVEDEHLYVKANKPAGGTTLSSYGDGTYNNEVGLGVSFVTNKLPGSWRQIMR